MQHLLVGIRTPCQGTDRSNLALQGAFADAERSNAALQGALADA